MRTEILELCEDIEVSTSVINKLLEVKLHTERELYDVLDDSLSENDFIVSYINKYVVDTDTKVILDEITHLVKMTPITIEELRRYVEECNTETQLLVTLKLYKELGNQIVIPTQESAEYVTYGLINLKDYIKTNYVNRREK